VEATSKCWEVVVRYTIAALILIGVLGVSAPSLARDIYFPKQTADQLKAICDKVGGKLSQADSGIGCGTDCHGKPGTDCTVYCPTGKRCVAQVIGGRRPRDAASALLAPKGKL
jgi:hypothetical protein